MGVPVVVEIVVTAGFPDLLSLLCADCCAFGRGASAVAYCAAARIRRVYCIFHGAKRKF